MKTKPEAPSKFTLHLTAIPEVNPQIIWPFPGRSESMKDWESVSYEGNPAIDSKREKLVRVFPSTGKDVIFLRMLQHRVDKFAPANGHGVLVKERLIFA